MKDEGAASLAEERRNSGDQGGGDPAFPQDAGECVVVDVIEPCLDVQKRGGDLQAWPLQSPNVIGEGEARIVGTKPGERTALVRVQQPLQPRCCEEAGGNNPFKDFRDGTDEDYYPERGG